MKTNNILVTYILYYVINIFQVINGGFKGKLVRVVINNCIVKMWKGRKKMIVTTISKGYINSISLPEKVKGQFWLFETIDSVDERLVNIEGIGGDWIMKATRQVKILDNNKQAIKNTVIWPQAIYVLEKMNGEKIFVFTEPITEDRQTYTKYLVKEDVDLTLGRYENSDIFYNNKTVSSQHAKLSYRNGIWFIEDTNSTNGIFVNEQRVTKKQLNIGDTIFIMGMKIIIGKNIVAFNNPDNKVTVTGKLKKFIKQTVIPADEDDEYELAETECFYRSPRFKRDIEKVTFKVDSPPASPVTEEMPWLLVMGSSLAMGMMSLVTLGTAIATFNITSMVMGGSMLLGTVLLPSITKNYEKKHRQKKEEQRQKNNYLPI